MLTLKNVSFDVKDDGGEKGIIRDLSLSIDDHKFVVITGPNGGGKSTLAKLIAGIIKPTAGQIFFDDKDITDIDVYKRQHWSIPHLKMAVKQGFLPDIISSDSVRISEYVRPGFSLLYAMAMLSAAGMKTEKILKCVTLNPARALGIVEKAGALKVGMPADVTVLDIREEGGTLSDFWGNTVAAGKLFVPLLTMIGGRVAYRQIFF